MYIEINKLLDADFKSKSKGQLMWYPAMGVTERMADRRGPNGGKRSVI